MEGGMEPKRIDDGLSVGGQIGPEATAVLRARGFRSILCNRPDGEEGGQPSFAAIAAAAHREGMEARHLPVSGRPEPAQGVEFERALREMPGPVFAYCRSGDRSAALAALAGRTAR
jgi:sulfide:quinone oxidoreductase